MAELHQIIDAWNRKHPECGIAVDVKNDFGEVTRRYTESIPWVLGGEVVILVSGISGGYLLERCTPVDSEVVKTTGIIGITFKDSVPEDIVQKTIEKIYTENKDVIEGMSYHEFNDENTLSEVLSYVNGSQWKDGQKEHTLTDFVEAI